MLLLLSTPRVVRNGLFICISLSAEFFILGGGTRYQSPEYSRYGRRFTQNGNPPPPLSSTSPKKSIITPSTPSPPPPGRTEQPPPSTGWQIPILRLPRESPPPAKKLHLSWKPPEGGHPPPETRTSYMLPPPVVLTSQSPPPRSLAAKMPPSTLLAAQPMASIPAASPGPGTVPLSPPPVIPLPPLVAPSSSSGPTAGPAGSEECVTTLCQMQAKIVSALGTAGSVGLYSDDFFQKALDARATAIAASNAAKAGVASAAEAGADAMREIGAAASELTGIFGAVCQLLAIMVDFLPNHEQALETQLIINGFARISQQMSDIASQLNDITAVLQGSDAVQTYISDRNTLLNINSSLTHVLRFPFEPSLYTDLIAVCTGSNPNPQAWLDFYEDSLSADGSCSGYQCLLDPDNGVNPLIGWDRTRFLDLAILFISDAQLAANLVTQCQAVQNVSQATLNGTVDYVRDQYLQIVSNIQIYYNTTLATSFWHTQFIQDVHGIMDQAGDDNAQTALSLQGTLAAKYDQLRWGAAVWDGVSGSDEQGLLISPCDVYLAPPDTCTASGGSYHELRFATGINTQKSFMIFFSNSSDASLQPQFPAVNDTVMACSTQSPDSPWNAGSMTDQVTCLSSCADNNGGCAAAGNPQAGVRAALAVKFGNGLRAKYDGDSNYFNNVQTRQNCTGMEYAEGTCSFELPEISYMILPVAPSNAST